MSVAREHAVDFTALQALTVGELQATARSDGLDPAPNQGHAELLHAILERRLAGGVLGWTEGVLEVLPDGFGFLRSPSADYAARPIDAFVSPSQIRRLNLKTGHCACGPVRGPRGNERFFALQHIESVNGADEAHLATRVPFSERTPVLPTKRLSLDGPGTPEILRAIDLLAPWGSGQRVLVETPPGPIRARLLTGIAERLLANHGDLCVVACMIDQRPEDAAVMRRALAGSNCEVVATTFDEPPGRHVALADIVLARVMRQVEAGADVVLLFDSLTALVRACNVEQAPTGRLLCAGLDAAAVQRAKRLFSAARACEEGGSLTVIATALSGTVRTEQAILEEFWHRGNSEVTFTEGALPGETVLDVVGTATRAEDSLLPAPEQACWRRLRRELAELPAERRLGEVTDLLGRHPDNADLLRQLAD
jgi:transcription termination factor Rho